MGLHHIPRSLQPSRNAPNTTTFLARQLLKVGIFEVITTSKKAIPGENGSTSDQISTQVTTLNNQPSHQASIDIPRTEFKCGVITSAHAIGKSLRCIVCIGLLNRTGCLKTSQAEGSSLTIELNQQLLAVVQTQHLDGLQSRRWRLRQGRLLEHKAEESAQQK